MDLLVSERGVVIFDPIGWGLDKGRLVLTARKGHKAHFEKGADGVLIAGCHPGDCHYINGNYRTAGRFPLMRKMLEQLGVEPGRIRLEWVSAAEGDKFARVVTEFTEEVRALGPLGWNTRTPEEQADAGQASSDRVEEAVPA